MGTYEITRTRSCNDPSPAGGGIDCPSGGDTETKGSLINYLSLYLILGSIIWDIFVVVVVLTLVPV